MSRCATPWPVLRGDEPHSADPLANESEPNDTCLTANLVSLDVGMGGEISSVDDVDCFRFSAPARRGMCCALRLRAANSDYDSAYQPTGEKAEGIDPGAGASLLVAPRANATVYVEVSGNHRTMVAYSLKLTALKAYDEYEPNDEIGQAHHIPVGKDVAANMTAR
jgi:hypothetical protein